jgi:hypothetical protein
MSPKKNMTKTALRASTIRSEELRTTKLFPCTGMFDEKIEQIEGLIS